MKKFLLLPVLLLVSNALIAQNQHLDTLFTIRSSQYTLSDTLNPLTVIYSIVPYDSNIKISHLTAYSTSVWTNSIETIDTTFVIRDNVVYRTILTFFTPLGGHDMRQAVTDKLDGRSGTWDFESIEIKPVSQTPPDWTKAWRPVNDNGIHLSGAYTIDPFINPAPKPKKKHK